MTAIRRTTIRLSASSGLALLGLAALARTALASEPVPWGLGLQESGGPIMGWFTGLHDYMLWVITLITLFVIVLLSYIVWRFNAGRNPTASQTSHNTPLEVVWTVIPVLILVSIAVPGFRALYKADRAQNPDLTVKVTAHQWYWSYLYPDADELTFDSRMVPTDELQPGQRRLLEVDNELVVPAGKVVRVLITSTDVIHSWFVPSIGMQRYAIPGRTMEAWFQADRPGTYYGQCNQICGTNHAFMPIAVRAVPEAEFTTWLAEAKQKFAANGGVALRLAAAASDAAR